MSEELIIALITGILGVFGGGGLAALRKAKAESRELEAGARKIDSDTDILVDEGNRNQIKHLNDQVDWWTARVRSQQGHIEALSADVSALRLQLDEAVRDRNSYQTANAFLHSENERLRTEVEELRRENASLRSTVARQGAQMAAQAEQLSRQAAQLNEQQTELAALAAAVANINTN